MIDWRQQPSGSWFGYSGDLMVAMVVKLSSGAEAGWHWKVDGARNPENWLSAGYRKNAESARRAAMRYWDRWIEHAGLVAKPASVHREAAIGPYSTGQR